MEKSQIRRNHIRIRRQKRVRNKLRGSDEKPRLCVVKSNKHIHAQLIDDDSGATIACLSTTMKEFKNSEFRKNKSYARQIGVKIAELAKQKEKKKIVFDRGRYQYHGIIAAVAEGAREGGLEF